MGAVCNDKSCHLSDDWFRSVFIVNIHFKSFELVYWIINTVRNTLNYWYTYTHKVGLQAHIEQTR